MKSPEGVKYLANEDQFLAQIVKAFAQLDPVCLLFSPEKVALKLPSSTVSQTPTLYFPGNVLQSHSHMVIWKCLEHLVNTRKGLSMFHDFLFAALFILRLQVVGEI
jgi:hypothetical protein